MDRFSQCPVSVVMDNHTGKRILQINSACVLFKKNAHEGKSTVVRYIRGGGAVIIKTNKIIKEYSYFESVELHSGKLSLASN